MARAPTPHLLGPTVLRHALPLPLHVSGLALGLKGGCILKHALRGILAAVEQHILHKLQQLLVNLLIHIRLDLQAGAGNSRCCVKGPNRGWNVCCDMLKACSLQLPENYSGKKGSK